MLECDRLSVGSTVNILVELVTEGDEDIWTQELKLFEETCRVPEQLVSDVLVVTEALSISSEKVTEMDEAKDTNVSELAGEVDDTVGAVVSNLKA